MTLIFSILKYLYLFCNVPSSPAYCVFASQLFRLARAFSLYEQFQRRGKLLTKKLIKLDFQQSNIFMIYGPKVMCF